jgi:GT2 family glycosyltransferase
MAPRQRYGKTAGDAYADARAIALVNRLLAMETEHLSAAAERVDLRPTGGSETGDVKRTSHPWKLAEEDHANPADFWLFDIKVDDAVVLAARQGSTFLKKFNLLGNIPDDQGAVSAINAAMQPRQAEPDVSIIIPVHGQLGYTLNCLHSLALHETSYAMEIIVIDDASPDASGAVLPLVAGITYHRNEANTGFVASCNEGGRIATGRYVILLNNDTRVVAGWLDELIGSFSLFPRAGLVGSKLHYADGSLQEAGGIVWRDGRAGNYGRGDDPNRPDYSFARQVDYVSGCSIALPVELWRKLGGFDPWFSPAYCEDVDLAFRVREAGFETWFQPQSRIVHYEGKTAGFDISAGTKAYQVANTAKLFLRWRETLTSHRRYNEAAYLERERGVRKRFLIVDVSAPTPDQDAGSVQTFLAIQAAMAAGYKTYFVPEDNWLFQPGYTTALQRLGVECAYAPYETGFETYMRQHGWMFDVVMVYRPTIMERCLPHIRLFAPQAAVIFHVADLHHLRMERTAALQDDGDMRAAAGLMKCRELAIVNEVDCTVTHSSVECEILEREAPGAPVVVWPLMSAFYGTETSHAQRRDVCFLGGYRHPPNVDAVLWFVTEIFPILREAAPGLRFIIAGAHPPEELRTLACEDIVVAGHVPDLRTLFDTTQVFVCPLRVGAGVKGKIVSALSYGLPVVATSIGVEGAGLTHETDVLVADGATSFAAATLRLIRDPGLWNWLSGNGQILVRDQLSPAIGAAKLERAVATAYARKLGLGEDAR